MIKGLIWDLDGVITDTSKLHREAWIEALKIHINVKDNIQIENDYNHFFSGVPRLVGIKRFLDSFSESNYDNKDLEKLANHIAEFKNNLFREKVSNLDILVYPDALSLLKFSKDLGLKNGLASQSENADFVLDKSGIRQYLDASATGITAKKSSIAPKPDPDFYRHAVNLLGLDIKDCIVFEDTYAGAYSAVTAGANICVGVARSNSSILELASAGCDIITRDLRQFKKLLKINNKV